MSENPLNENEIRRKAWEFELGGILDKHNWLTNEEARQIEQETAEQKGTLTRGQYLNRQLEQLTEDSLMVRNNPDEVFYTQVYEAKRKEVVEMARSTTPKYLTGILSRNMAENLERVANKHGISFFTGTGSLDKEEK